MSQPPDAEASTAESSKDTVRFVVTACVLAVLVAAAVVLGIRDHRHREGGTATQSGTAAEQAALAAARGEAVALMTISYKTAAADLNRVLAGSTGTLHSQFEKEKGQLPATLARTKSVSRGTVLSSGLSALDGSRAQALVALDQQVSGTDTGSAGVQKHYRMVVTLQKVGDQWLASDVAFEGAPQ